MVAIPRNIKKDNVSLVAHMMIEEDIAGSTLNKFNIIGIAVPKNVAIEKVIIMDIPDNSWISTGCPLNISAIEDMIANIKPLINPTDNSLKSNLLAFLLVSCLVDNALIVTVKACNPALPLIDAIIGIITDNAIKCWIVF